MIDSLVIQQVKTHGPGRGVAVSLGNQEMMDKRIAPDAATLFKRLGYSEYIDIDYNTKAKLKHDLNFPVTAEVHGKAAVLYDGGVMEHVPNIGQALADMVSIVQIGGIIIGNWPLNHPKEECYYQINPLLPADFFRANGFEVMFHSMYRTMNWRLFATRMAVRFLPPQMVERIRLYFRAKAKVREEGSMKQFIFKDRPNDIKFYPLNRRFYRMPPLMSQIFVARKTKEMPLRWPHQDFYPDADTDKIGRMDVPGLLTADGCGWTGGNQKPIINAKKNSSAGNMIMSQ